MDKHNLLTPEQIAYFNENGFLAVGVISPSDEVERLREIYDRMFAEKVGREDGNQFDLAGSDEDTAEAILPQILSPSRYFPELADTAYRRNALAIAQDLLGPGAAFMGDHAILKPAYSAAVTPWHQDEAYWNPDFEYRSVSIWMPLQPVDDANGCLSFVPGSHRWDVAPHHPIGHDTRVHGLEADAVDAAGAISCPLPAGGATIHLARTMHYAGENRTAEPRRAYILGYGLPPQRSSAARDFYWNRAKAPAREQRAAAAARRHEAAP